MLSFAPVNYSSATYCPHFITRKAMYVKFNIEARSCNHCGKAVSTTFSMTMFVALGIQHAMGIRHFFICGLSGSTISFHTIS